jgi:ferritin-like metal-binding protein YciE
MNLTSLHDLYVDELRDLHSAEKQLITVLPKLAEAADNAELRAAILEHLEESRGHMERLEDIFGNLETTPKGKHCKAMEGLIEEGNDVVRQGSAAPVRDAALIAAAQRIEHYEMAGYGCVRTYARMLGYREATDLLQQTLDEEASADETLTILAESVINQQAINPALATVKGSPDEEEQ